MPSTPGARTGAQPGGRSLLEAADSLGDVMLSLKLRHALQALGDDQCSVPEAPFRDHARDPLLLARQGTALQVSGCGTQQPEHVRIIAHGSRPECWGSRGLGLHLICGYYSKDFKYIG